MTMKNFLNSFQFFASLQRKNKAMTLSMFAKTPL